MTIESGDNVLLFKDSKGKRCAIPYKMPESGDNVIIARDSKGRRVACGVSEPEDEDNIISVRDIKGVKVGVKVITETLRMILPDSVTGISFTSGGDQAGWAAASAAIDADTGSGVSYAYSNLYTIPAGERGSRGAVVLEFNPSDIAAGETLLIGCRYSVGGSTPPNGQSVQMRSLSGTSPTNGLWARTGTIAAEKVISGSSTLKSSDPITVTPVTYQTAVGFGFKSDMEGTGYPPAYPPFYSCACLSFSLVTYWWAWVIPAP